MKINPKHVATFAGFVAGAVVGKVLAGGIKCAKMKVKKSK